MNLRRWQSECISKALNQYQQAETHFLCLATPGAGKTAMAAILVNHLFNSDEIDLVICLSPSVVVAEDFQKTLEHQTNERMDGLLGSKGRSLTYQAMLFLDDAFWSLFERHRVFVIFDEIHHCAADAFGNSNAWGQVIAQKIQGKAKYTLALTGTPWRSDQIPIVLSNYCSDSRIHCDFIYGLVDAVKEGVCRKPCIMLIDNDRISYQQDDEVTHYSSFGKLLTESNCSYQQIIENEVVISHVIERADKKLTQLRKRDRNAGGLLVASSVEHANLISQILRNKFGEQAKIATYREEDPQRIIREFKYSSDKWIISVGMISEGTNIPRLSVCCHLTRIKTELHFRQVLGRILRASNNRIEEGFLYMPAEPSLIEYASRIEQEIPESISLKLVSNENTNEPIEIQKKRKSITDVHGLLSVPDSFYKSQNPPNKSGPYERSLLAKSYDSSINIFGKFKQQIMSLPRLAS